MEAVKCVHLSLLPPIQPPFKIHHRRRLTKCATNTIAKLYPPAKISSLFITRGKTSLQEAVPKLIVFPHWKTHVQTRCRRGERGQVTAEKFHPQAYSRPNLCNFIPEKFKLYGDGGEGKFDLSSEGKVMQCKVYRWRDTLIGRWSPLLSLRSVSLAMHMA